MAKYKNLRDREKIAISTCLSRKNFELVNTDFLDFLKNLGIKRINLEADLINPPHHDYKRIVRKLFELYKYGKSIGLIIYGYWSKPFSTLIKNQKSPIAFCAPIRGEAIAVTSEGKIQPCVYINELVLPLDKLKKINTFSKYRKFLISKWKGNLQECKGCELEGICIGGCYVSRTIPNKEVFKYRCILNKQLTPLLIRHFLKENYKKIQTQLSKL